MRGAWNAPVGAEPAAAYPPTQAAAYTQFGQPPPQFAPTAYPDPSIVFGEGQHYADPTLRQSLGASTGPNDANAPPAVAGSTTSSRRNLIYR